MKNPILFLSFLLFPGLSACAEMKPKQFTVTTRELQIMDGFGASDAWSFWQIGTWSDSLQTQVADWLFSSETDASGKPLGIALSIWRFNAGSGSAAQGDSAQINFDTRTETYERQTGQRRFLSLAQQRGVPTFLAFYNTPPVHLTKNGLGTNTGRGGTLNLREDAYTDFALYIADMLQKAECEDGIHFSYVCPVNEPDGHWNWQGPKQEGTPATNREIARLAREMNTVFLDRGITTKILVNESSDYRCMFATHQTTWQRGYEIQAFWNPDSTETYLGNLPTIAPVMAGHSYWTNTPVLTPEDRNYKTEGLFGYRNMLAREFRKVNRKYPSLSPGFWMTELCIMGNDEEIRGGGGFDYSMEEALYVARVMHYDITVAQARSWQWWRAAGGDYKDGLIRMFCKGERPRRRGAAVLQNYVRDSKLMWTLGNFSRFVRPGAVRLKVKGETTDPHGLMVSAYRNLDGNVAVVVINYSEEDIPIKISLNRKLTSNANPVSYRTSDVQGEDLLPVPSDGVAKARSVTTIVY